ncbi:MAG: DUF1778 domain-containing protein [Tannerella sp.]|jgi:uncharacterized protein (DUF1778 family)|nr:DUF1778 domain-containing protein [Tannerella sp.]
MITERTTKTTRFDTRLPMEQKLFFEKAAQIGGYRNLTDFIISTAMEKAKSIVEENGQIIASQRDSEMFFNAIMQQIEPNQDLKEAVTEYNQLIAGQ